VVASVRPPGERGAVADPDAAGPDAPLNADPDAAEPNAAAGPDAEPLPGAAAATLEAAAPGPPEPTATGGDAGAFARSAPARHDTASATAHQSESVLSTMRIVRSAAGCAPP
jgi:hypothetical protein